MTTKNERERKIKEGKQAFGVKCEVLENARLKLGILAMPVILATWEA